MSDAIRNWTCAQVEAYMSELPRYKRYAETLQAVLGAAARRLGMIAIVQTRPKSPGSFAEKIQRKRDKYQDPIHQLTDLCGGRVITDTQSEVLSMCRFIEDHFEIDWENSVDVSQRLKPAEFGYRSIHYIISFKPGEFPSPDYPIQIPELVYGLKAEVQVRTVLEHAWASFVHDRIYKGGFNIPNRMQRQIAGLAAMLEDVGQNYAQIEGMLHNYTANYGGYLTEEQMQREVGILRTVLEYDPGDAHTADRIGRLAVALGDWSMVVEVLTPYAGSGLTSLLRNLGMALTRLHAADPDGEPFKQGQRYLELAGNPPHNDPEALVHLANSLRQRDDERVRALLFQAYELDPFDSYILAHYLDSEVAYRRDLSMIAAMSPVIRSAIKRNRDQADVSINMPWAFYNLGKLHLLLNQPDPAQAAAASLSGYAKAISVSARAWMVETSLQSLERLEEASAHLPAYPAAKCLLTSGLALRFGSEKARESLKLTATPGIEFSAGQVMVLTGGCDPLNGQYGALLDLLRTAFQDFHGTLLGGGMHNSGGRLLADLQACYPRSLKVVAYRPAGETIGVMQAVQPWADLAAAGVDPKQVKVLAMGGCASGRISAVELRVALALGARVGVVRDSSQAAASLLNDDDWSGAPNLFSLPEDASVLRAFVGTGNPRLENGVRETLARSIHETYRLANVRRAQSSDPALAEWDRLPEAFRESNSQQADHIFEKLRELGCTVNAVSNRPIRLIAFSDAEVESLAQMEHGRWTVERLLGGWKPGSARDPERKINPLLVPWSALPEEVRESNRQAVRAIPRNFAALGLEITRLD